MTSALEQHDEGNALGEREFGDAPALRGAAGADGTGQRGEVLRPDHDRTTVDGAGTGHDAISRHLTHERADLAERARIEQMIEALASVELALGVALGESLGTSHGTGGATTLREIEQRGAPTTGKSAGKFIRVGHTAPLRIS